MFLCYDFNLNTNGALILDTIFNHNLTTQDIQISKKNNNKPKFEHKITLQTIKKLGLEKRDSHLDKLIEMFASPNLEIDIKREIASSIGRQKDSDKIYNFLSKEAFKKHYMEVIYQMFRTCLYKSKIDNRFINLRDKMLKHYQNEVLQKMYEYYEFKQKKKVDNLLRKQIVKPSLLIGDNRQSLKKIKECQIQLVFTSPPYYNARLYNNYKSYQDYLNSMKET